jgi:hypothetical protein
MDKSSLASMESEFSDHFKLPEISDAVPFKALAKQDRSYDRESDMRNHTNEVSFPSVQPGVGSFCTRSQQPWAPYSEPFVSAVIPYHPRIMY